MSLDKTSIDWDSMYLLEPVVWTKIYVIDMDSWYRHGNKFAPMRDTFF